MSAYAKNVTGRQIFVIIATFFGVIIAVNATLAILAVSSWSGLVVENGYVASQAFNQDLAEARRQTGLGWKEGFGYTDGRMILTLADSNGQPIANAIATVKLQRPSTDREDRRLTLTESAPGIYGFAVALSPGLWDVEAIVHTGAGETLRRLYRIHVAGGKSE